MKLTTKEKFVILDALDGEIAELQMLNGFDRRWNKKIKLAAGIKLKIKKSLLTKKIKIYNCNNCKNMLY